MNFLNEICYQSSVVQAIKIYYYYRHDSHYFSRISDEYMHVTLIHARLRIHPSLFSQFLEFVPISFGKRLPKHRFLCIFPCNSYHKFISISPCLAIRNHVKVFFFCCVQFLVRSLCLQHRIVLKQF